MKNSGLTEKKMANKKFQKTETAIFTAYYKFRDFPTAKTLARRAKISRSTLYRHHEKPSALPKDYENYLLETYARKMRAFLNKDLPSRTIFLRTLVFISNNRTVFTALFKDGHKEIVKKLLDKLKPQILKDWNYAGNTEKLYKIYQNEILGLIETWSEDNFDIKEVETVLNDIIYLNKTTPRHLARFLEAS